MHQSILFLNGHVNQIASAPIGPLGVGPEREPRARRPAARRHLRHQQGLFTEICTRRLRGLTKLSREEMRLAGYSESAAQIDVCEGVAHLHRCLAPTARLHPALQRYQG
jgi:hypothetical protein